MDKKYEKLLGKLLKLEEMLPQNDVDYKKIMRCIDLCQQSLHRSRLVVSKMMIESINFKNEIDDITEVCDGVD